MIKRFSLTTLLVLTALGAICWKYQHYLTNPWTRDGQIRAQVIQITPRVTGPIVALHVKDNAEVKAGDPLFEIDPRTYQAALDQSKANLMQAKVTRNKVQDEARRTQALFQRNPEAVSALVLIKLNKTVEASEAAVMVAHASVEMATLNLAFTKVKAPADGFVTNLTLHAGSQVVANQPALALVDRHSFWIEGFFKETDISDVKPGEQAVVTLMAYTDQPLQGRVESIGYGIAHKDGSTGTSLLPNVSPTFQWIRLAQRVPVRIELNAIPENVQLRVGTSASVMIIKRSHPEQKPKQ